MSEQNRKKTIKLVICMIVCIVLTSLIFTNSIICNDCDKKITGKYYISLLEKALCKDCGKDYYRGWPGNIENVTDKVPNTLRNILVIIEIFAFGAAVFHVNKDKTEDMKKSILFLKSIYDSKNNIYGDSVKSFESTNNAQGEDEKTEPTVNLQYMQNKQLYSDED